MSTEIEHIPVLPDKVLEYLAPKKSGVYVDATLGGGGHTEIIASCLGNKGRVIAIDRDKEAIEGAKKHLVKYQDKIIYTCDNFGNLDKILEKLGIEKVDGILFDLGVSTYQLESPKRGFSFNEKYDTFLDMRMDASQKLTAFDVVNKYPEKKLRDIFYKLGEEPYAKKIARGIVLARKIKSIKTTKQLLEVIRRSTPPRYRFSRRTHWATNVFRAIRMEVNHELPAISKALPLAVEALKKGGRLAVISFHSLEDRIVKRTFREAAVKLLTKKPITAGPAELKANPKSRSARLRATQKL